jgi:transposase
MGVGSQSSSEGFTVEMRLMATHLVDGRCGGVLCPRACHQFNVWVYSAILVCVTPPQADGGACGWRDGLGCEMTSGRRVTPCCLGVQARWGGGTARENRVFVEAVLERSRAGIPWRALPERFEEFRGIPTRYPRGSRGGVWKRVFERLAADLDNEEAMLDSTIVHAHQHRSGGACRVFCVTDGG